MKKNLKLMYIIAFLQGLVFYAPVSLIYRKQRGLLVSEFFFLEFILLLTVVLTEVLWGYFADKYGYKKTLIISYSLFFLGRISLLFCNSFTDFFIQTIFTAFGVSGISGCDIAFLYRSCDKDDSEKIFGRYRMYSSVGFLISSILSVFIISISVELAIVFTSIAYGMSVILVCFTEDLGHEVHNKKEKLKIKESFKDIKSVKYILIFVASTAIISEIAYGINITLGQLHFESIDFDIRFLGFVTAFSELMAMLSSKTYILSNKFGQSNTLKVMVSSMLLCVGTLVFTNSIIISILCIASLSGLIAMTNPIVLDIQNKSISKNRATILSIYSMIGGIFTAFLNIIIGFLTDIYLKYAFVFCFIILLMGVFGVYFYISKQSESLIKKDYNKV